MIRVVIDWENAAFQAAFFVIEFFSYRLRILIGSNSLQPKRDYYSLGITVNYLYLGFLKCQPLPTGHL